MRNLTKVASLALLASALLVPAVPASATAVADDPFSVFKVSVKVAKTAKAGGKLNYTIVATNTGPYEANAYFLGGQFPKDVDLRKIYYRSSVKGTECGLEGRALYCLVPKVLKKDESIAMIFETKLKKTAKGTETATLGVISYDLQTGMEDMSKEELERLGVPEHGYAKTVKTKIVR
ncbi:hypothetical protein [Nonomuraea sp. NPDC049784]|uniref:hypothetical protein n=1 Tax=Nonomuraea sp. NPDC049784 TaxID=3154361 RepID=UPI0033EB08B7